jgi:ATP-dependent helicase/nuclease subunit A
MEPVLHDQPARDRFQSELDVNFCVSAGAGVGKTTSIVHRIANLARSHPGALPRLVVVTYAKAAAEELRVRARTRVLGEISAGEGSNLLASFRQAFFGTIHSFCLKLVREFGAELGVDPGIDLLEEEETEFLWARYCESPELDAVPLDREALAEVTRFLTFDELLKLAKKIDPAQAARLLSTDSPAAHPPFDFTQSLADAGGRSREVTRGHQESIRRFIADFEEGGSYLRIPQFKGGSGTFLAAYQQDMFPFAAWLNRQAARLAAAIAVGFRDYRREQRLMTYPDQIAWCRALLDNAAILEELRARDWIVLLDEAQDTDAAMFAILSEVTRPPGSAVGDWPAHATRAGVPGPRPGRFCFVGDEQQSIYASRAIIGVYRTYIDAYAAHLGGERLEFSVTMRCPQRVIGVVNAIFFHEARLKQTHFAFRELHSKPRCVEGAAWLLPIEPLAQPGAKTGDAFNEECRQVATFLINQGRAGLGIARWDEVAILCPRNRWLRAAAEIFIEAGLPCRLVSKQPLQLELPERSWPAALLHVLLNPWDRFELIGILREIFAVSDVELADAQAENKPFDFWSTRGLSPRLAAALDILRALHSSAPPAGDFTLAQYLRHVLDGTRLAARLDAIGQPADALAHLQREALRAELAGTPLRSLVAQLVRNLNHTAPEPSTVDDEIPLMTAQKAKGREWPVVIPLGLARAIKPPSPEYPLIDENAGDIAIHVSSITLTGDEKEPRKLARREELQRIFYVTLTRARSLLILPDALRLYSNSRDSFMDLCRWQHSGWEDLFGVPPALAQSGTPKSQG